jgi:phosphoribosylaminoimidazole-succinocarboxamide synthase
MVRQKIKSGRMKMPSIVKERTPLDILVYEGKTKKIFFAGGSKSNDEEGNRLVVVCSKDDVTAGDGARHDVIPGKGILANTTTSNIFSFLEKNGVSTAYKHSDEVNSFISLFVNMIPIEVVVRSYADGSYCERSKYKKNARLFFPVVEFFLKTKDRRWKDTALQCDDPLMQIKGDTVHLSLPNDSHNVPFAKIPITDIFEGLYGLLKKIERQASDAYSCLEQAFAYEDCRLADCKIEFGLTQSGQILLADVIDADSFRLYGPDEEVLSKQAYREGCTPEEYLQICETVARITGSFEDLLI